jgi:hypothetical protein
MAGSKVAEELSKEQELSISFAKAGGGKTRTIPVWFVVEKGRVLLLPMYGLKTKWYQHVEKRKSLGIAVGKETLSATPKFFKDKTEVERVKALFGKKYGLADVRKYYPTSEIAIEVEL